MQWLHYGKYRNQDLWVLQWLMLCYHMSSILEVSCLTGQWLNDMLKLLADKKYFECFLKYQNVVKVYTAAYSSNLLSDSTWMLEVEQVFTWLGQHWV